MSDFFKFVKTSLGLPARSAGPGHVLGGRSPAGAGGAAGGGGGIEVAFQGDNLGISVSPRELDGIPEVESVVSGSEACAAGVRPLDVVTHVASCPVHDYDGFASAIFQAMEQRQGPIMLRFSRPSPGGSTAAYSATATARSGRGGDAAAAAAARARAAEQREAAWSRRVAASSAASARKSKAPNDIKIREEESQDSRRTADAEKCINEVKRAEAVTIETLGYNPYRPVMSGSSASRSAQTQEQQLRGGLGGVGVGGVSPLAAAPSPSSLGAAHNRPRVDAPAAPPSPAAVGAGGPGDRLEEAVERLELLRRSVPAHIYDEWSRQIDESFGILTSASSSLSSSGGGGAPIRACLDTAARVISNLLASPDNQKFSKIRLSNPNFHKKVVSVRGGVEALIAAGFRLREEEGEEAPGEGQMAEGGRDEAGALGTEPGTNSGRPQLHLHFESPHESMSQCRLRIMLCRISILQFEMEMLE